MEVLVIGGNGFVGSHLTAALLGRGDTVRVLALAGEQTGWLEERAVAVHRGDIREPDTLLAPMRGAQVVVNLAAMMDVWRPIADYRAVNVTGAAEAGVRAARAASGLAPAHATTAIPVEEAGRIGRVGEAAAAPARVVDARTTAAAVGRARATFARSRPAAASAPVMKLGAVVSPRPR